MLLCAVLTVFILNALGDALKADFPKEENISDLQLLLPIKFLKSEAKVKSGAAVAGGRWRPHDGPYSRIPASAFELDDARFLFDATAQKTVKKDLSRPTAFAAKSLVMLPPGPDTHKSTNLVERCRNYLLQSRLRELLRTSFSSNKPTSRTEQEMLVTLCEKYLNRGSIHHGKSYKGGIVLNSVLGLNGMGGMANRGATGQRDYRGNIGGGPGGYTGYERLNGQGGVNWQGGYVGARGSSSIPMYNGVRHQEKFSGGLGVNNVFSNGIVDILSGLGIGNVGTDGQGGFAGNLGMNGFGNHAGNLGANGQGGFIGNAAINGVGGAAGNIGWNGQGGHVGNLGVGGKGGLFGNLGIGGQGGFFGNVGIGTNGDQNVDLYTGHPNNILDYLLGNPTLDGQQAPLQYVSLGHISTPEEKDFEVVSGSPVTSETLEYVPPAPSMKPLHAVGTGVVAGEQASGGISPAVDDTSSVSTLAGSAATVNAESLDSKAIEEQKPSIDNTESQTEDKVVEALESNNKNIAGKLVARNNVEPLVGRCAVGALAVNGYGRQVGNLALGGAGARCGPCVHVYYLGPAPAEPRATSPGPAQAFLADATPASPTVQAQSRFRPASGRRGWMVLDDRADGKLRQYINSRKPWVIL